MEENTDESEVKEGVAAGLRSGLLASLCCVGPLIIVLLGLGTVSFALSLGQYRPYFLALGFLSMASAVILHLRRKNKTCDVNCFSVEGLKQEKHFIASLVLSMAAVYVIAIYVLVPAVSPAVYASAAGQKTTGAGSGINPPPKLRQLDLQIAGMTCTGCASGVEYELKKLSGVVEAEVEYPSGTGRVIYDPAKITKEDIVEASDVYPATIVNDNPINKTDNS